LLRLARRDQARVAVLGAEFSSRFYRSVSCSSSRDESFPSHLAFELIGFLIINLPLIIG